MWRGGTIRDESFAAFLHIVFYLCKGIVSMVATPPTIDFRPFITILEH